MFNDYNTEEEENYLTSGIKEDFRTSLVAQMVKSLPEAWETPDLRGKCSPQQYSSLRNPMDRGAWRAIVQGVARELNLI